MASASRSKEKTCDQWLLRFLQGLSNALDRISIYAVVVIMTSMTAIVFTQVIFRFVLNNALPWPEEVSRYLMIWACFLGSAIAVKRGEHIGVTFIRERIPAKAQTAVGLIVNTSVLVFLAYATYYGFGLAKSVAMQRAPASRISMFWAYSSIPAGSLIMFVHALVNLLKKPSESGIVSGF